MQNQLSRLVGNCVDVLRIGPAPRNLPAMLAEFMADHRVSKRRFMAQMLPKGGVGVELGVFTGLFSTELLRHSGSRKIYFVDPWHLEFGAKYPDWGRYTGYGRLLTSIALTLARSRIQKHARETDAEIVVGYSTGFLSALPDAYLDWAYVDSSHSYRGTKDELALLKSKVRKGGLILGDDWHDEPDHAHSGVAQAVNEAIAAGDFVLVGVFPEMQWMIRRV